MTGGWRAFGLGTGCALGVLGFLNLVAHEIERAEDELIRWEAKMAKERKRQQMLQVAPGRPATGEAA